MSSTAVPAEDDAGLPPWQRPLEAPIGDDDVAWARSFLRRWRIARAMLAALLLLGAASAGHWALTDAHTPCRRQADARLAAIRSALMTGAPLPEGRLMRDARGEGLLILEDGALVLSGTQVVAGAPRCPEPLW